MRPTCLAAAAILASVPPLPADPPDRLAEALSAVSFERSDLGCRPKTWWSRFGHFAGTRRVPFFFPDLFAEPLRTYETSRVMAGAMERYLSPSYRTDNEDGAFKTAYFLGFTHMSPAHRGYRAGTADLPGDLDDPLAAAVEELYRAGGGTAGADLLARVRAEAAGLPPALHRPLARFLWRLAGAHRWAEEAFEAVPAADQAWIAAEQAAHEIKYAPALRRASAEADLVLLTNTAQQALQAAESAHRQLSAAVDSAGPVDARILWPTPLGRVLIAGTGADEHGCGDCLAVIDLGGGDTYVAGAGAGPDLRIAVVLDLSGDDTYRGGGPAQPVQGAAVFGVGLLWDGGGSDRYEAEGMAQGSGFFGAGILWDEGDGDDAYRARFSAQGAGCFGLGLLVDGGGDDTYYLWGDGQGFGGPGGGIGVLGDAAGDDTYTAEIDARITGRGSYHTASRVTSSHAQGAAIGRRADLAEGYSWAGGLGALVDLSGDDVRRAGNWALGSGYWFGTGLVYDGGGDDLYEAVYYSMASGAHFCIGAIFDEGNGDDRYRLVDPPLEPQGDTMNASAGAGLAFGWDYTMGLLVDKGGDDWYEARIISGAQAMIRSTAILADLGSGNDTYVLPEGAGGGHGAFRDSYARDRHPHEIGYGPYSHHGTNFGFLLDTGGRDRYLNYSDTGEHPPSAVWKDGATWLQPAPGSEEYGFDSFGVGMDVEGGTIPEFTVFAPKGELE